jgi:hypothetical protein
VVESNASGENRAS